MSRAFTKESDPDAPVVLPERSISELRNYMTSTGFDSMRQQHRELQLALEQIGNSKLLTDNNRRAELQRDLRYCAARLESAEEVIPVDSERIRFGNSVCFIDPAGTEYVYRIVGEDEADVAKNRISWASPLARALIGHAVGDICLWPKGERQVEIELLKIFIEST